MLAVVLVACLLAVVTGCSGSGDEAAPATTMQPAATAPAEPTPPEDTLRLGVTSLDHLDPAYVLASDQAGMVVLDLLYDGLTAWDPATGAAVPALAETWEADPTQQLWRFTLRADATFADGSPVTAADVKFSLERQARMGVISLAGVRLEPLVGYQELADGAAEDIAGVQAVDDRTLAVALTEPRASLPELLSSPLYGVVPRAVVEADPLAFDAEPVGSGPYRFDRRDGERVHLVAEEGRAPVGRVVLERFAGPAEAHAAFEEGRLDWSVVPAARLDDAAEAHGRDGVVPFTTQLLYGFDLDEPHLADVRFRTAISQAIDRDALLASTLVAAAPLDSMVPPGVPGRAEGACGAVCLHDPERARALVAEVFGDGPVPAVAVDVYDDPLERAVGEQVVASLQAVGIPAELVVRSYDDHLTALADGDVQVFSFSWVAIAPDVDGYLGALFLSDSPDNVSGLADGLVDLALRGARAEPDRAARLGQYADVDRLVSALVPMVPIAVHETAVVVADRVEGFVARPDGTFVVEAISLTG
jgi:ABC-type transport system substrate-binding protein